MYLFSRWVLILASVAALANPLSAQFVPALLQNASYWGESKAEVDFYSGEFVRDGQKYPSEILVILSPTGVDPVSFAPGEAKTAGLLPAIQMTQAASVPRGLVAEQWSLTACWRMDFATLARLSFAGTDGSGNIAKTLLEKRDVDVVTWNFSSETYRGKVATTTIALPKEQPAICYDELPVRVRTIDFSKTTGDFEIQMAPTLAGTKPELGGFKPAKVSWTIGERSIEVSVQHANGTDRFVLDRDFPFLLRDWKMADGSSWKMTNSLRADYRKYSKPGDRERALKDPMLRHPD